MAFYGAAKVAKCLTDNLVRKNKQRKIMPGIWKKKKDINIFLISTEKHIIIVLSWTLFGTRSIIEEYIHSSLSYQVLFQWPGYYFRYTKCVKCLCQPGWGTFNVTFAPFVTFLIHFLMYHSALNSKQDKQIWKSAVHSVHQFQNCKYK